MATKETVIATVPLGDDREIKISHIRTDEIDLIRIAPFLRDEAVSGAIFPGRALSKVIAGLQKAERQMGKR